jgi:hypothetical protein
MMDLGVAALIHPYLGPAAALYSLEILKNPGSNTVTTIQNDGGADSEVTPAAVPPVLHSIILIFPSLPATIHCPPQQYSN